MGWDKFLLRCNENSKTFSCGAGGYYCNSSGHCYGTGSIPGLGTSTWCGLGQTEKKKIDIMRILKPQVQKVYLGNDLMKTKIWGKVKMDKVAYMP